MDNNRSEKISLLQYSILMFIFTSGSAVVVGIGAEAKKDAWLAIGIATIIGLCIFRYYLFLIQWSKQKDYFSLLQKCFGKWIGKCIILLYVLYFYYLASRVLRDFGELMVTTIYPLTPVEVINILLMLTIAYILRHGVEVLARTAEIFIPYIASFVVFVGIGLWISGEIHISFLQPVLGDGWKPVLKAVFPALVGFPFGETIVFTILFQCITVNKNARKVALWAIASSGLLLVYGTFLQIGVLGSMIRNRASFPLLTATREITLLNFIERVDLVIVFTVMFGIVVKVSIFFYGGLKGLEQIISIPYRRLIVPHSLLIAFLSILISENYAEHLKEGLKIVPLYLHMPMQIGIPLILLPVLMWKQKQIRQ